MHITVNLKISNTKRGDFSYSVTAEQYEQLKIGAQVIVNMSNQLKCGTVITKSPDDNFDFKLKPIVAIFKATPLNDYQAAIAKAIYHESMGDVLEIQNLFVDPITDSKINIEYYDNGVFVGDFKSSKNKQQLIQGNYQEQVVLDYKDSLKTYMYVTYNGDSEHIPTAKQQLVIDVVCEAKTISVARLIEASGISRAVINGLIDKGVLLKTEKSKQFETLFELDWHQVNDLTVEQSHACASFQPGLNLLYGVSSSGKTEVYIELIKRCIANGQQALIIVPSVMLAVQVVGRMQRVFDDVIIFHSKLSEGERASFKQQIEGFEKKIVISTFDGLFLPYKQLGLVIFDEAHSSNYRVAKRINVSKQPIIDGLLDQGIDVLLGTATPLIGDYAQTEVGKSNLINLNVRYGNNSLPDIDFTKPTEQMISERLDQLININKTRNKPTIIFFNKSGYSKQVLCNDCFHLHVCPHCHKPLTYSQKYHRLECKYDGFKMNYNGSCLNCASQNLKLIGMGIEQFHQQLQTAYPDLIITTVDGKMSSEDLYQVMIDFGNGDIDILLGTSTIAFGIDFLDVDTVYIVNVDNMLTRADITSHEQTFNILEQVAGRVGRNSKYSKAIIETDFEDHFVMQALQNHNYYQYYQTEMKLRKETQSFPYFRTCKFELICDNPKKLETVAEQLRMQLRKSGLAPSELQIPYIDFRFNKHRRYILIKYRYEDVKTIIKQNIKLLNQNNIDYNIDLNNLEIGV
ncbi:primosomal protein N' [Mollicutes bacterium LVI A0039]|nr:primosomal protein N' [Mollicutes bacterium LVI A0039]